jgi:hypothetical protein
MPKTVSDKSGEEPPKKGALNEDSPAHIEEPVNNPKPVDVKSRDEEPKPDPCREKDDKGTRSDQEVAKWSRIGVIGSILIGSLTLIGLVATVSLLIWQNTLIEGSLSRTDSALALTRRQIVSDSISDYRGDSLFSASIGLSQSIADRESSDVANTRRPSLEFDGVHVRGFNNEWGLYSKQKNGPFAMIKFINSGAASGYVYCEMITFFADLEGRGHPRKTDSSTIDTIRYAFMGTIPGEKSIWFPVYLQKKPVMQIANAVSIFAVGRVAYRDADKNRFKTIEFSVLWSGGRVMYGGRSHGYFGDFYNAKKYEGMKLDNQSGRVITAEEFHPEKYPNLESLTY